MLIKNVKVYTEDRTFEEGEIVIRDGIFERVDFKAGYTREVERVEDIKNEDAGEVIDAKGCFAIPGLIDLHFHGCMGCLLYTSPSPRDI